MTEKCVHGIVGDPAVAGYACPYCESRDMPDYIRRARFKCLGCGHEFRRGPNTVRPDIGFTDNACPRCGHVYLTWLNHPRHEGEKP